MSERAFFYILIESALYLSLFSSCQRVPKLYRFLLWLLGRFVVYIQVFHTDSRHSVHKKENTLLPVSVNCLLLADVVGRCCWKTNKNSNNVSPLRIGGRPFDRCIITSDNRNWIWHCYRNSKGSQRTRRIMESRRLPEFFSYRSRQRIASWKFW